MLTAVVSPIVEMTDSRRPLAQTLRLLALAIVALQMAALGCVPLDDLSGYSGGAGTPTTSPSPALIPREPSGGETEAPTAPADPGRDGVVGEEAPLDTSEQPSAEPAGQGTESVCSVGCAVGDAGPPDDAPAVPVPGVDAAPPAPACASDETTGPNALCYVAVAQPLSWEDARAGCRARRAGWDLASIRSGAENLFVRALLVDEAWVGATDALLEGTWAWVADGFEFWVGEVDGRALNGAFVNWFGDEPNGTDTSDCMRLLVDALWADLECGEVRSSICEGPPR